MQSSPINFQGICGLHFENSCFVGSEMINLGIEMKTTPKRKALKEGAIPTLNLTCPIEDYVIRSMKRVTIKAPDGEVIPTNKIRSGHRLIVFCFFLLFDGITPTSGNIPVLFSCEDQGTHYKP